ncbi:Phosphodiest-domain-containing protein [Ophiobolus disseminans]|uniref:Phosphodiest-domain-containing protein n=1 Tax=Ophiobolus disseminans TaxID=1469910 RepID=A0A6A7ADS1_9PLEO|nr:Phosphodiest-domain-containing protein [Ophiobolus disseminans]
MSPRSPDDAARPTSDDVSADERTLYDPESDMEDYDGRPSGELLEGDQDILDSEDERDRLLTQKDGLTGMFGKKGVKIGKLSRKAGMKERKSGQNEETSALMYEMEEGIGHSSSSLRSRGSSESDGQRLLVSKAQRKTRKARLWRRVGIYMAIVVLFVILLAATYKLSTPQEIKDAAALMSNGTSLFAPTTILISLDGFRADFLYRNITPTLNQFIQEGISPKYMLPSFPSVTFPNHYTMATGMYPEAHGVVGNTFWDPKLEQEFYYTDPNRSLQPLWWGGEPLWVTAERQKVRTAVHMWPGSEAHIDDQEIAYVDKYNGSELLPMKTQRILDLLDVPGPKDFGAKATAPRPQLIAAYVPNVDSDGHRFGPNSTEIKQTIANADAMLGLLLRGLHERNLTNIVNVVVVSDHGMATTDVTRLIQLEDLVDPAELSHVDGWPLYGLRPKNPLDLHRLYDQIKERTKDNPNVEVYLRDENMPERYHFSRNKRIAPLWIIPKAGWAIVDKNEFDIEDKKDKGDVYHPRGLHGYDHEHPLMRAIFVARGPAFPHAPGSRMEPFQNIELYNIICDSLHLTPAPNNGTLRLPLTPSGHHNDSSTPDETPADPPTHALPSSSAVPFATPILATMPASLENSFSSIASGMDDTAPSYMDDDVPIRPTPPSTTSVSAPEETGTGKADEKWWEWLAHKAEGVEEWVSSWVGNHTGKEGKDG